MDLIIYTLRSVATAIVGPLHALMLIIIGIIFYVKNRRVAIMQKMTIGESLDSPLELTLSQIVLGILAGAIGSIIITMLGITFSQNSGIEFVFMASILLMFYRPRFVCFSYSGSVIGALSIIITLISKIFGQKSFLSINVLSLLSFVGVIHIIEGLLVMIDGSRGAIPVFTKKEDKIIGGFSLNRYWALPIAVIIMFGGQDSLVSSVSIDTPVWWPLINRNETIAILASVAISFIPFYGMVGYSSVTFTKEKKKKALYSGIGIFIYGASLLVAAQVANLGIVGQILAIIYMPLSHELMLKYQRNKENKNKFLYVSDDEGISVLEVAPSSPAFEVGIRRGDKIMEINGHKIESEREVFKIVADNIFKISIKIRTKTGNIVEYLLQPRNKRLGMLLVPKMVKLDNIVDLGTTDDFKRILEELRSKK
jgi:hypothetical protein